MVSSLCAQKEKDSTIPNTYKYFGFFLKVKTKFCVFFLNYTLRCCVKSANNDHKFQELKTGRGNDCKVCIFFLTEGDLETSLRPN